MKHRHVIMQTHRKAHERLSQAQNSKAQTTISREDEDEVHEEKQEVEDVAQGLHDLQANVGGAGRGVEELERLDAGDERGEAEDGEVDGEVDLDEDEEFLEGEVGFETVEDEGD